MAIAFSCTCGKTLKARDEFAGRKMRCSACKKVVAIPAPSTAADTIDKEGETATAKETALPLAAPVIPTVPAFAEPVELADFFNDVDDEPPRSASTMEEENEEDDDPGEKEDSPATSTHPWQDRTFDQTWTV